MKKLITIIHNLNLQKKIVGTYLFVCIIPTLIVGIFAYIQSKRLIEQTEKGKLNDYLMQVTFSMENQLNIYENLADYAAFNDTIYQVINYPYHSYYELYERYTSLVDPFMNSIQYLHNEISKFTIYSNRITEEHGTYCAPLEQIINQDWYKEIQQNSDIVWFAQENNNICYIRKMMTKSKFDASSLLYMEIQYNKLFQPLQVLSEENIGILVVDNKESIIYKYENFLEEYESYLLQDASDLNSGRTKISQNEYYVSSNKIKNCEWTIYLYKPIAAVPNYINQLLLTVGIVILASFIIMFGVGVFVSYFIVKPIKQLTDNMKQFANDGQMEVTVTSEAKDEVGIMIRSFGKMVKRIHTLINENYKKEISLKEFEIRALQAQINPHFLYNTLSMINWKAIRAGEKDISKIALRLASFYRTTLNKGNNITTVKMELQNINDYLEIQLFMHDNSFDVIWKVQETTFSYSMPNLILQPIIENAIEHGIDLKESGKGILTIQVYEEKEDFILSITDNGVGMSEKDCEELLFRPSKGYGLRNVNERIQLIYGNKYHLSITSELEKGTVVLARLPIKL